MGKATKINVTAIDMGEKLTQQSVQDLHKIDVKQLLLERKIHNFERMPLGNSEECDGQSFHVNSKTTHLQWNWKAERFLGWCETVGKPNGLYNKIESCLRGTAND